VDQPYWSSTGQVVPVQQGLLLLAALRVAGGAAT
jgi:hypothetical protein